MWFKNLHVYQLVDNFSLDQAQLENQLASRAFRSCGSMVDKSLGWVAPLGRDFEQLVHRVNGCFIICLRKEQKVIPASAVKEALEEKINEQQEKLGRKIYRTEKLRLKDDILASLLPKALVKSSHLYAYFDLNSQRLMIDSASATQVDEFYQILVESMGSFGASPFMSDANASDILNQWVLDEAPKGFQLKGEYWLKDLKQDRVAQFKDLEGDNHFVADLIKDGYSMQRLGIVFGDELSAAIQDSLQLRRLKFSDQLLQENKDLEDQDAAHRWDADFVLMSRSLASLVDELETCFAIKKPS